MEHNSQIKINGGDKMKYYCPMCEKEMDFFEEEDSPHGMTTRFICRECKIFVDITEIGEDEMDEILTQME